jgi:hypothetical protein
LRGPGVCWVMEEFPWEGGLAVVDG